MKKFLLLFTILSSLFAKAQTGIQITDSINVDGVYRSYSLYVPLIHDVGTEVPLLLNFHGLRSTSAQQESYGDFRKIADTANFIIVHPQGLALAIFGLGIVGWNTFSSPLDSKKDLDFTSDLIDTIKAKYNINLSRVYSTGLSNGGFMSHVLACHLSGRIAAIASVSGSMVDASLTPCNALHPMPIMQIHGNLDSIVGYNGTEGWIPSVSVDTLLKHWVGFNDCNPLPSSIDTLADIDTTDMSRAIHYVWDQGREGSTVEFYKIVGGGHAWPGSATILPPEANVGYQNMDFNASKEIWRFFSQQKSFVGMDEQDAPEINFKLFPNPTNGDFNISISTGITGAFSINATDLLGNAVFHFSGNTSSGTFTHPIHLENVAAGIYFIRLSTSSGEKIQKLMVQ